jgi:4-hydroxybenzoate polyprenyltransferase
LDNTLQIAALSLCGACILWTTIFDTVYAQQDIEDNIKAVIRSLAVRFGENTKPVLSILVFLQIMLLVVVGLLSDFSAALTLASMLVLVGLKSPVNQPLLTVDGNIRANSSRHRLFMIF